MKNILLAIAFCACGVFAAADLNMQATPFAVITIPAAGSKTILLPHDGTVRIRHANIQNDAGTASAAADRIVVQHQADTASNDLTDGNKIVIAPGGEQVLIVGDAKRGTDGAKEIRIYAVGNAVKVQLVRESK
jgi:hypothetical protein